MYHVVRREIHGRRETWHVIHSTQDAVSAARLLDALRAAEITRGRPADYRIAIIKEDV